MARPLACIPALRGPRQRPHRGRALRTGVRLLLLAAAAAGAAPAPGAEPGALGTDARNVVDWIVRDHDNHGAPFLVVDKRNARLLVFDAHGTLEADSPVLLGAARGDDSVPGIGQRKMRDIRPFERTTPAGRFEAEAGRNLQNEDIVWIDYDAAVSMHRVRATNPRERRLQRLATPTIADNRISWGCINVPAQFFNAWVSPLFSHGRHSVVYVLPEVHPLAQVFPRYAPATRATTPPA
jgi:hypothetical protein